MALTETWLKAKNGKVSDKTITKADSSGLSARVSPKGKINFQYRYRHNSKQCRLDLGTYPLISLKQARIEAERMRAVLETGRDPRIHRKIEKQKLANELTFAELYTEFHEKYCVPNKKNADQILRTFELYVFPKLGKLPADEISIHEWLDLLESQAKRSNAICDRILVNTKQCFGWGIKRQLVKNNHLLLISGKNDLNIKKNATTRVLDDREICLIWNASEQSRMSQKNVYFVWLCLFFGCRTGELRLSKKSDFDLEDNVWTIPPENHKTGDKTGKPIIRPIIESIKPILLDVMALNNTEYMFTNESDSSLMSRNSSVSLPYNILQFSRRNYGIEIEHFSMHDLRRTARTNFSQVTQPHVAEIMLGHTLPKIQGTYDHYSYLDEQKEVYEWWWTKLVDITSKEVLNSHLSD